MHHQYVRDLSACSIEQLIEDGKQLEAYYSLVVSEHQPPNRSKKSAQQRVVVVPESRETFGSIAIRVLVRVECERSSSFRLARKKRLVSAVNAIEVLIIDMRAVIWTL